MVRSNLFYTSREFTPCEQSSFAPTIIHRLSKLLLSFAPSLLRSERNWYEVAAMNSAVRYRFRSPARHRYSIRIRMYLWYIRVPTSTFNAGLWTRDYADTAAIRFFENLVLASNIIVDLPRIPSLYVSLSLSLLQRFDTVDYSHHYLDIDLPEA